MALCTAAAKTFSQIFAIRFFLGIFESAMLPGVVSAIPWSYCYAWLILFTLGFLPLHVLQTQWTCFQSWSVLWWVCIGNHTLKVLLTSFYSCLIYLGRVFRWVELGPSGEIKVLTRFLARPHCVWSVSHSELQVLLLAISFLDRGCVGSRSNNAVDLD